MNVAFFLGLRLTDDFQEYTLEGFDELTFFPARSDRRFQKTNRFDYCFSFLSGIVNESFELPM